ncbi:MAG: hypothetical protein PHW39_02900 [Syntrophomonadaceae bacterium]|jgi:hypothetical protein|nr:hypothetical protein [Clostridia bacterium]MDD4562010.1 hypothetical protein [Syntrophomonadaceae bacterium]
MKLIFKFADGIIYETDGDQHTIEGDFLRTVLKGIKDNGTINLNNGQLYKKWQDLYSIEIVFTKDVN